MQSKPIFVGFAAGILILVVAAASFSAGLYLGQRGYVQAMQYQAPQQGGPMPDGGFPQNGPPQPGPQGGQPGPVAGQPPQGGPPGAPSWPPDVIGRVAGITSSSITLDTPNGPLTVALDASTRFLGEQGQVIASGELKVGDVVAVFGREIAVFVMRLPPPPSAP